MTQHIDMSGTVLLPDNGQMSPYRSDELGPFMQAAIKKALEELAALLDGLAIDPCNARYDHLAPETLAWFIAEGERFTQLYGEWPLEEHGRGFWEGRQRDKHSPEFEPATLTVRDDGLIYVAEGRS